MLFQGLDNVSSATLRPFNSDINTPRIDSYRFSMANLEGELSFFISVTLVDRHDVHPCNFRIRDFISVLPKKKKKSKFFPLFLFTLVMKVTAAPISDSRM